MTTEEFDASYDRIIAIEKHVADAIGRTLLEFQPRLRNLFKANDGETVTGTTRGLIQVTAAALAGLVVGRGGSELEINAETFRLIEEFTPVVEKALERRRR